jgi:hypothetical protein
MSIQNLFDANGFHLYCDTMTCNNIGSNCLNTCANEGTGIGVFDSVVGVAGARIANFKSLVAGGGISITPGSTSVTISDTGGGAPVQSVFGRTGTVTAQTNDYSILQIANSTVLANTANTVISSPTNGQIIAYNGGTNEWQNQTLAAVYPYYNTIFLATPTTVNPAIADTYYTLDQGGSVLIAPLNVGDHLMITTLGNNATVTFSGSSFVINSYLGGGTVNPTFSLTYATIELVCVLNSGQTYYQIVRVSQNRDVSVCTLNGTKIAAIDNINDIPDLNITSPNNNDVLTYSSGTSKWINSPVPASVTSVGLTVPSIFSVSGSPITSSGTLAITANTETAATVYAGPISGVNAVPTFRALATSDIPTLPYLTSFNTRTGPAITPASGDYTISQITNSTVLANTANTVISSPSTSQVVLYNGSQWANSTIYTYTSTVFNAASALTPSLGVIYINGTTATYTIPTASPGATGDRIMIVCSQSVQCTITFPSSQSLVYNETSYSNFSMNSPTGSVELIIIGGNQWTFGSISGKWGSSILSSKSFDSVMYGLQELANVVISSPSANQLISYNGTNWVNIANTAAKIYTSAGQVSAPKVWMGTATTVSGGTFSVSISSASFTTVTSVLVTAQLSGSTAATAPIATVQTSSTTTITGIVVESATVILGGSGLQVVGAGIVVNVVVYGS